MVVNAELDHGDMLLSLYHAKRCKIKIKIKIYIPQISNYQFSQRHLQLDTLQLPINTHQFSSHGNIFK